MERIPPQGGTDDQRSGDPDKAEEERKENLKKAERQVAAAKREPTPDNV